MYRLWSKCVQMNLKRTPLTFKIKLTHNFGPLGIIFSLRLIFLAKMGIFCIFGRIGYREPKQFQSKYPCWLILVHWNTFLPHSKQNSKFSLFCISISPYGSMWNLQTPCTGGFPVNWFQNFLSSMIMYNHSSYFKSGEINSCRLSPLPTKTHLHFFKYD